jgi:hypothetical protein
VPDEPYRPSPPGLGEDTDLARLAAEGQRRILEAKAGRAGAGRDAGARTRDRNLRVALGGYYGAPIRTTSYVLIAAGIGLLTGGFFWHAESVVVLWPVLLGGVLLRVLATPLATPARVAAERAWQTSLPFTLEGYFETLADEPALSMRLAIELQWNSDGRSAGEEAIQGLLGLVDTDAEVHVHERATVRIQSGVISGDTWIQSNGGPVKRNTRIVPYVHDLVDKVLLPLYRDCPIARISIARR